MGLIRTHHCDSRLGYHLSPSNVDPALAVRLGADKSVVGDMDRIAICLIFAITSDVEGLTILRHRDDQLQGITDSRDLKIFRMDFDFLLIGGFTRDALSRADFSQSE